MHTWCCINVIVWTETISPLLDPIHVLTVRAFLECVSVFVHVPRVSPGAEEIAPIPSYTDQRREREENRAIIAPQWANEQVGARVQDRQWWQHHPHQCIKLMNELVNSANCFPRNLSTICKITILTYLNSIVSKCLTVALQATGLPGVLV